MKVWFYFFCWQSFEVGYFFFLLLGQINFQRFKCLIIQILSIKFCYKKYVGYVGLWTKFLAKPCPELFEKLRWKPWKSLEFNNYSTVDTMDADVAWLHFLYRFFFLEINHKSYKITVLYWPCNIYLYTYIWYVYIYKKCVLMHLWLYVHIN